MGNSRMVALMTAVLLAGAIRAADESVIPSELPKAQKENLLRFLNKHDKPDRYIPQDAKIVGVPPGAAETKSEPAPGQTIKQYTVQIISHRPVPDQQEVKQADVYYYRPNPEKGKQGVTIKHTVDLTTGEQIGQTEVLLNKHTPISRDELKEAIDLAKDKSSVVKDLYKGGDSTAVRWEYLQLMINRKQEPNEPGDRVIRVVFTPTADSRSTDPVRVIVNLTKGVVVADDR